MKNVCIVFFFTLLTFTNVIASCEDTLSDSVDYTSCQFSDEQNLSSSYLPNSNLSFTGLAVVIVKKSSKSQAGPKMLMESG